MILYLFGERTLVDDIGKETLFFFRISIGEDVVCCETFMK